MIKNTTIGDVFMVKLDENHKKFFQYIANDLTQLNSDVIRVFEKRFHLDDDPELNIILTEKVEFYAHCVTKWGIKLGFWTKVGNSRDVGELDHILFRTTDDERNVAVSSKWWIWHIGSDQQFVGRLKGEHQRAEIGSVMPPDSIVHRMKTGEYDFVYPRFE